MQNWSNNNIRREPLAARRIASLTSSAMSGGSTPQGGTRSPAPPEGGQHPTGPSPLLIGKKFVKQYYQTLTTTPDQIHRFYQPASILSDGEGSSPTHPVSFESMSDGSSADKVKDRFILQDFQIRFEFEHGAIDAQESVNDGILLVVTGHVVYDPTPSEEEDAAVEEPVQKRFVHTFFLNSSTSGTRKNWYVHNDILRFLVEPPSDAVETTGEVATISVPAVVPEPTTVAVPSRTEPTTAPELAPEPKPEAKKEATTTKASPAVAEEAPGGGVEESKEEPPEPTPKVSKKGAAPPPEQNVVNGQGEQEQRTPAPPSSPVPKTAPGSWASVAASSGAVIGATSPVKTPTPAALANKVVGAAASKESMPPSDDKKKDSSGAKTPGGSGKHTSKDKTGHNAVNVSKRDPDCTLVIKNLADGTKESDVLGVFEHFATDTKTKVVGITVSTHRGIAFVDYDSVKPVMKAVDVHQKEPIRLMGRILEVDQKTAEQRSRRAQRPAGGGGGSGGGGGNYRNDNTNQNANNGSSNGKYGAGGGGGGNRGGRRRDGGGGGGRADRGGGQRSEGPRAGR